jgi:hypothetical protein
MKFTRLKIKEKGRSPLLKVSGVTPPPQKTEVPVTSQDFLMNIERNKGEWPCPRHLHRLGTVTAYVP